MNLLTRDEIELVWARWVSNLMPPENVPDFAVQALQDGYDGAYLRKLAGLENPTRADIGNELELAFCEMGYQAKGMSELQAGLIVVRHMAQKIVEGRVPVKSGASLISSMASTLGYPSELLGMVILVDEYLDDPEHPELYESGLIDEATQLLGVQELTTDNS